jgi:hypothetical protein
MEIIIYQRLTKSFPPIWQHHHLMITSTIVSIIQWEMSLIVLVTQFGETNPRLDASLLQ